MSKKRILMTGGTGFLGKSLVPLLQDRFDVDVISRSGVGPLRGDLCHWNAGLSLPQLKERKYDLFLHAAGLYDLAAAQVDCYQHNITAMGTALKVAGHLGISTFISTSTVAAAINSPLTIVKPYDLNFSRPFPDFYAQSKALGEQVLQNWENPQIQKRINLRLGVLVGDSRAGRIERVDGPYHAADALQKVRRLIESFPANLILPGDESIRFPLVPVDVAAQAIAQYCGWSLESEKVGYQSFHLTPERGVGVREFYHSTLSHLKIPYKGISLVRGLPDKVLTKLSEALVQFPEEQLSYLLKFPVYDTKDTREILGDGWCPEFKEFEEVFWRGYEAFISNR